MGVAALAAGAVGVAAAARSSASSQPLLKGDLYGNIPNVTIRGIAAGEAPWVVDGSAILTASDLTVKGTWLVVPSGTLASGKPVPKQMIGTTAGVKSVVAAVSCANTARPLVTPAAALSANGTFSISAMLAVPKGCAQPIVLVGPSDGKGGIASWFASTDFLADYGQATPAMIKAFSKTGASSASASPSSSTGSSGSTWG